MQAAAYLVKMIRTVLIAIFLACGAESCRMVVKTLTVSGSNGWGDWGQVQYCIEGSYVTGFRLKVNGLLSRTINQNSNNFSETTALKQNKCLNTNDIFFAEKIDKYCYKIQILKKHITKSAALILVKYNLTSKLVYLQL